MDTYMTILYVTVDQEIALKQFFLSKGWMYCKPDLNVITENIGPYKTPSIKLMNESHVTGHSKIQTSAKPTGFEKSADIKIDKSYNMPPSVVADESKMSTSVIANSNKMSPTTVANCKNISPPLVANNNNSSVVKVEVSCTIDDDNDNFDDGDNDDDFADSIGDNPELQATSTHGINVNSADDHSRVAMESHVHTDHIDNSVDDIVNIDVQTCTVTFQDKEPKNPSVIDKKLILRELTRALKTSKSGLESSKTDHSVCHYCKRSVRNRSIRRHLMAHLNLPYKCGRCTLYFNTASELERHKVEKHTGEFVCSYCGVKYRHKNSLNEHVQKQHEGTAKVFECKVCGVQMCRLRHLEDHMNTHRNVNPYTCSKCGKGYKNKCAYKRHNKTCGSNVKHACDQCGQLYSTVLGLRDHIKRCHEEQRDFKCICGVDFKTRSARCRHRLKCDTYITSRNGTQLSKSNYESAATNYPEVVNQSNNINSGVVDRRLDLPVTEYPPENEWSGDQC